MAHHSVALLAGVSLMALASASPAQAAEGKSADARITALTREVEDLKTLVHELQDQVKRAASPPAAAVPDPEVENLKGLVEKLREQLARSQTAPPTPVAAAMPSGQEGGTAETKAPKSVADMLRGITVNALLDGYYEYNLNHPIGRVNSLRAYDVSSNNFSLNQADLIVESAPDPDNGKRYGARIDLQFGQATSTLQGNPANELRPEIYRSVFQAYGSYVFPLGKGLTVDFGKWASSLGYEGNYTKDQLNYSRSFWFDYLPFYHMGFRVKYAVNDKLAFNLWITNGTQQTEAFNNFKDQMYGFVLTPTPTVSWTVNYYRGQEHPDIQYLSAATQPNLPSQQGTFFQPIPNPPNGLLNIWDSYAAWQPQSKVTLAAEADYVTQRLYTYSPADKVYGGALYAAYQLSPRFALAARAEYLADHGGLFSGTTQNLKETTLTFDYRPAESFLIRAEVRRDWSDQRYFLSKVLGELKASQPTIGLGMVWWFGQKEGAW